MIKGLLKLNYEEILKRCQLTTVEKKKSRGDFIKAFKILSGKAFYLNSFLRP